MKGYHNSGYWALSGSAIVQDSKDIITQDNEHFQGYHMFKLVWILLHMILSIFRLSISSSKYGYCYSGYWAYSGSAYVQVCKDIITQDIEHFKAQYMFK